VACFDRFVKVLDGVVGHPPRCGVRQQRVALDRDARAVLGRRP